MKTPVTLRRFREPDEPLWPSAAWAAVIVLVLFPIVVGGITGQRSAHLFDGFSLGNLERLRLGNHAGCYADAVGSQPATRALVAADFALHGAPVCNHASDGCNVELPSGADAVAVSLYSHSIPYFPWENEYVSVKGTP